MGVDEPKPDEIRRWCVRMRQVDPLERAGMVPRR